MPDLSRGERETSSEQEKRPGCDVRREQVGDTGPGCDLSWLPQGRQAFSVGWRSAPTERRILCGVPPSARARRSGTRPADSNRSLLYLPQGATCRYSESVDSPDRCRQGCLRELPQPSRLGRSETTEEEHRQ